jgi:hypothetical protein
MVSAWRMWNIGNISAVTFQDDKIKGEPDTWPLVQFIQIKFWHLEIHRHWCKDTWLNSQRKIRTFQVVFVIISFNVCKKSRFMGERSYQWKLRISHTSHIHTCLLLQYMHFRGCEKTLFRLQTPNMCRTAETFLLLSWI